MRKKRKHEKSEEEIRRKIQKLTEKLAKATNNCVENANPPEQVINSSPQDTAYDWTPYCEPYLFDHCDPSMPCLDALEPDQPSVIEPTLASPRSASPPLSPPRPLSPARREHTVQRDRESSVEREARLSQLRDRYRAERERESSVEREVHRSRDRERRIQRARESSARVTNSWVNKENSAMNYDPSISYKDDRIVSIGTMSVVCEHCLALKFKDESKGMCCLQGKVKLEEVLPPPEPLHSLLTGDHQKSKQFMRNIRRYNNAFQMTSFKSKQVVERGFMPSFKIQGQVYHLAGSLLPLRPDDHKFLRIYFIADPDTQASTRCTSVAQPIDRDLIRSLQDMLHSHNCYIQSFKTAIESVPADTPDFNVVIHANKVPVGEHRGRYNAPSTSEVASSSGDSWTAI